MVRLWHIIATILFVGVSGFLLIRPLGFPFAIVAMVAFLFAIAAVLRNAGNSAFTDLDALLLKIPVVATIYENWFRVDTYYRTDTRTLYLKLLPEIIKAAAEDICAANGVKLVQRHKSPPPLLHEIFLPAV